MFDLILSFILLILMFIKFCDIESIKILFKNRFLFTLTKFLIAA